MSDQDMYCENCGSFFGSGFQDNEAYCPICNSTEITEANDACEDEALD